MAIIARKKDAAAETLSEVREEYSKLDSEAQEKKSQLKQTDGDEVLKGEEVKIGTYVTK